MVSALMSSGHPRQVGCLIKVIRSNGRPWKWAFVMSPDLTVSRSHEAQDRRKVQFFDVAGWRVRPYTSGCLQISAVD